MKAKRERILPLPSQTLETPNIMKLINSHRENIFSSRNNSKMAINSQTANDRFKHIDYKEKPVAHALNYITITALNYTVFNSDVIKYASAYIDTN